MTMPNARGVLDETEKKFLLKILRENPIGVSQAVETANIGYRTYLNTTKKDPEFKTEVERVLRERIDKCMAMIFDEAVPAGDDPEARGSIEAADLYIKNHIAIEKHDLSKEIGRVELAEKRLAYMRAKGGHLDAGRVDVSGLTLQELSAFEKSVRHEELSDAELPHYNNAIRKLRERRQGD
jgi:hypothetical protein